MGRSEVSASVVKCSWGKWCEMEWS